MIVEYMESGTRFASISGCRISYATNAAPSSGSSGRFSVQGPVRDQCAAEAGAAVRIEPHHPATKKSQMGKQGSVERHQKVKPFCCAILQKGCLSV